MTRSVDDIDPVVIPICRGRRRSDGDTALLLLDHPVHGRGAFVYFTDLVVLAGVVQDALCRGCFARINVGHDTDITISL